MRRRSVVLAWMIADVVDVLLEHMMLGRTLDIRLRSSLLDNWILWLKKINKFLKIKYLPEFSASLTRQ